jgi:aminoglycoside 3-N-acetyltransferase
MDFRSSGIEKGDVLMVHASLSAIGCVEGGARTVVEAIMDTVGPDGHVLMPSSPIKSYQLDYIQHDHVFDVLQTPSAMGAISENFRLHPGVVRSAHPTEPICCAGKEAEWFITGHFGMKTPYGKESPFYKAMERKGKILYLGVTLANAGTHLHVLEDLVDDFPFSVYYPILFEAKVRHVDGVVRSMNTFVHNPLQSKQRRCDDLIPLFMAEGVMRKVMIGKAPSLLVDAAGMLQVMLSAYREKGITMYTPKGR